MSSMLLMGMIGGCGTGGGSDSSSKGETTKHGKNAPDLLTSLNAKINNNKVILYYKVKNISGKTRKLTFPSSLQADAIVFDEEGKKVKQFSDGTLSAQVIQELNLKNNQEISKKFTIGPLSAGHYKIEAFLTAKEEAAKAVKNISIPNSE